MARIIRNWVRLSGTDRIAFGQDVKDDLANNSVLPATNPDYLAYVARFDALKISTQAAADLEEQLRTARLQREADTDAWLLATEQLAVTVESATHGDAAAISTTGFDPSEGGSHPPVSMTQVVNFSVTAGDEDGELDYQHDRVRAARVYEPQTTLNPNDAASWVAHQSISKTKGTLSGLATGTRVWVRVRAIGSQGPGPWSEPASKVVP